MTTPKNRDWRAEDVRYRAEAAARKERDDAALAQRAAEGSPAARRLLRQRARSREARERRMARTLR